MFAKPGRIRLSIQQARIGIHPPPCPSAVLAVLTSTIPSQPLPCGTTRLSCRPATSKRSLCSGHSERRSDSSALNSSSHCSGTLIRQTSLDRQHPAERVQVRYLLRQLACRVDGAVTEGICLSGFFSSTEEEIHRLGQVGLQFLCLTCTCSCSATRPCFRGPTGSGNQPAPKGKRQGREPSSARIATL